MGEMEVPQSVVTDKGLTFSARNTLTFLYIQVNRSRSDGFIWWKRSRIAETIGKTEYSLRKDLKLLESSGYIKFEEKIIGGAMKNGITIIGVGDLDTATKEHAISEHATKEHAISEQEPATFEPSYTIGTLKEPINNEAKDSSPFSTKTWPKKVHGEPGSHEPSDQMSLIEFNETPKLSAKTQQLHQAQELVAEFIKHRARVCKHLHEIGFHPRLRGPLKMPKPKSEHLKVAIKALDTWESQQIRNAFDFTIFEFRHFTKQTAFSEIGSKWMFWETITLAFRPGVIEHGVKGYERQLDNE